MRHSNRKEIGSCEASAVDPRHCQETLTELPCLDSAFVALDGLPTVS